MLRWKYQTLEQETGDYKDVVLTTYQYCRVMRWRDGRSQGEIANALNVNRSGLNKMEQGEIPCSPLLAYWGYDEKKVTTEAPTTKGE
jgi:hypothetical protein